MLDRVVEEVSRGKVARRSAEELLTDGIPLGLSVLAAAEYAQECRNLLEQLGEQDSLLAIKLRAAALIVPSALRSAQSDLDAAIAEADDLSRDVQQSEGEVARGYALAAWGMTRPGPEYTLRRVRVAEEILDIAAQHEETN